MVSSKLTTRRATVGRPAQCLSKPLPPVPPPPPTWPPQTFDLHFVTDYTLDGTPYHFELDPTLTRDGTSWTWKFQSTPPDPDAEVTWDVDHIQHTAWLDIEADNPPIRIIARSEIISINWNTPHGYHVTDWAFLAPPGQTAVAQFTF